MDHNEIAAECRKVLMEALQVSKDQIPQFPWENVVFDFASEHVGGGWNAEQIRDLFLATFRQWRLEMQRMYGEYRKGMQRHHDTYVRMWREGKITRDHPDYANYDLAMQRERSGLVKPLPLT